MALSYFKVLRRGVGLSSDDIFFFDDASLDSIRDAWELARAMRDEAPALMRKIVVWRKTALDGAWSGCQITFVSGLQAEFVREYQ